MSEEIVLSDRNVPRQPLQEELTRLYSQGFLTDITLSTEDGKNFEAHRILLAARSAYFHSIVPRLKSEPVIFLKGVKGAHLDKILKFIYGTSVAVSKHQLKPILEVAKVLQVKGLQDVSPNEVLSRQSVVSAGKFKPDSPLGSPLLTKVGQHQTRGGAGGASTSATLVDKTTFTNFKNPSGRRGGKTSSLATASSSAGGRGMQNGSPANSDSEEKEKDSDNEESGVGTRTRKRRGRPPKRTGKEAKGKEDPYEFEEDSNDVADRQSGDEQGAGKKGWRYQSNDKKKRSSKVEEEEEEEEDDSEAMSSPIPEDESVMRRERGTKYTINGKQVLPVKCKGELAELHLSRFVSGVRGHSINYKDQWMTPQEFEMVCGYNGKKYLENIQTDYGPLKALTASGMLKPLQQTRNLRKREDESPKSSPDKRGRRRRKRENEEEEEEDEEEEDGAQNDDDGDHDKSNEVETGSQTTDAYTAIRGSAKRKKKKHRDDWKRQIASQLKNESAAAAAAAAASMSLQSSMGHEEHPPQIHAERQDGHVVITSSNAFTLTMDQPPKISPSAMMPEQTQQQQTIYVMSPHPSMPGTPQHNPFASMSPHPHQLPMIPVSTSAGITMATMNLKNSQNQLSAGMSRIGSILNVRCKSTTALLYANKYESGSKGKCIQLGDEWLTPNEFEDRAGSKAKKYLSSIKCMGRPLRVYVNSGELRGSGPPPQPKGPKGNKNKMNMSNVMHTSNMHPIAPAPMQAPQTPAHMSSAPQLPPNLSMMMSSQPPILLNQQQLSTSMMGGSQHNLIPGMTFTIAQPLEVRQNTQGM